jgi:hypothetical protein
MAQSKIIPFPSSYRRRDRVTRLRPVCCKVHVLARRRRHPRLAFLPLRALKELLLCAARVVGA